MLSRWRELSYLASRVVMVATGVGAQRQDEICLRWKGLVTASGHSYTPYGGKRCPFREDVSMAESTNPKGNDLGTSDQVFFGLPNIFVDKGAHIAHFFRGDQERVNILAPYLQAGLEAGDQCLLVTEAAAVPFIKDHLGELGVDVEGALASEQLLVSNGGAGVEEMSATFEGAISRARRAGREVIRIGGDMTWALGKMPTPEKLMEWEALVDRNMGSRFSNFIALCQYDHNRFGGDGIMCALQTHPLSIIGNIVQENPFHRNPEEVLRELSQPSI